MSEESRAAFGELAAGSQIADYQVIAQIGRGGMATVYIARDVLLDRQVALKILAPELARDEAFRQRFIRESKAAAAVDHPHIVPIFKAGETDGVLFIAMRYVSGRDVRSLIDREGALPAARAVAIVTQVASALDAAHESGLVHRDVKPANMLLSEQAESGADVHVYLSDFGLSKQSLSSSALTSAGHFLGTLDYVAPEQIEGRPVSGRADLYSLACAAFEMLCGEPPFRRDQNLAVLWAQLSAPPPALTNMRPGLPPEMDQVLARAMAKSPADRYDSCLAFAGSLRAACERPAGGPAGEATRYPGSQGPGSGRAVATGNADLWGEETRSRLMDAMDTPGPHAASSGLAEPRPPAAPGSAAGHSPSGYSPSGYSPPPRRPARSRLMVVAVTCIAVLIVAGAAFAVLRSGIFTQSAPAADRSATAAAGSPSKGATPTSAATGQGTPAGDVSAPAATVQMYFFAINSRDYARAWSLGGDHTGSTYSEFVRGYDATTRDDVTILSVSGDVVTAHIVAHQTDGTVRTFQGTYTVSDGVISQASVQRLS